MPGRIALKPFFCSRLRCGSFEQREAALGDVPDARRRVGALERLHALVEPDAEVRVVPPDDRVLVLGQQELDVFATGGRSSSGWYSTVESMQKLQV